MDGRELDQASLAASPLSARRRRATRMPAWTPPPPQGPGHRTTQSGPREFIRNRDDVARTNVELTVTFPETGTYYLAVEAFGSHPTGSYSLIVTIPMDMATLSTGVRVLRMGANAGGC